MSISFMVNMSDENQFKELAKFEKQNVVLKWFSPFKGYGFVEHSDIKEDIFVHFSIIEEFFEYCLEAGDKITCDIVQKPNGYQVSKIYNVERTENPQDSNIYPDEQNFSGYIKWFNPVKGFGFACADSIGEDIFIHVSTLRKYGISNIVSGSNVSLKTHRSKNGLEAHYVKIVT